MFSCNNEGIPNYNLHTELQTKYLEGEYNYISLYAKGVEELSRPEGVSLSWDDFSNNENGGVTYSPLGESVNYYSVSMKSGDNCVLLNKSFLKDEFAIFGNADNYPVVMHCSIGIDRTGMLSFLINALLGVSEEDIDTMIYTLS